MSQVPAGWFNDPYGRFHQRYWDGERWTEHVATEGRAMVDPMGVSPVVPFATPASATSVGAAEAAAAADTTADAAMTDSAPGSIALLERAGPSARERTRPSLRAAVAGLGGAVVAIGVLVAVTGDETLRGEVITGSLVVLAMAVALRLFVHIAELQAAAIGLATVGIVAFGAAVSVSDGSGDFLTGLIIAVLFLAAWLLPGFRGVNLFLAVGLLALLAAFGSLSSDDTSKLDRCNQFIEDGNFDAYDAECQDLVFDDTGGFLPTEITGTVGTQGVIYLVGAAVFLGATWVPRYRDGTRRRRAGRRARRDGAAGLGVRRHLGTDLRHHRRRARLPGRLTRPTTGDDLGGCGAADGGLHGLPGHPDRAIVVRRGRDRGHRRWARPRARAAAGLAVASGQ